MPRRIRLLIPLAIMVLQLMAGILPARAEMPAVLPALELANDQLKVESGVQFLLEDAEAPWSADQASRQPDWQSYTGKTLNFRQEKRAIWLRMRLRNPANEARQWRLVIDWPLLDDVRLQSRAEPGADWSPLQQAGDSLPTSAHSVPHRLPVFMLALAANSNTDVYLRVQSHNTVLIPLSLIEEHQFQSWDHLQEVLSTALFSIVLAMLCYNACLYTLTRDTSYLFYCWYVAGIVLFELVVTGYGAHLVWQTSDWLRLHGYATSTGFVFVGATLFLRNFLGLPRYGGWLLHTNSVFIVYWSLSFVLGALGVQWVSDIQDLAAMISCVVGLGTTIYLWRKGNVSARYFTIAWSFLIIATFYFAASMEGLVERTPAAQYSQMLGFVLEVTLLSFALAERINRERSAREEAQQAALLLSQQVAQEREAKMESQNALIELQRHTNEELELRVLDRTAELQRAMTNLELANRELSRLSQTDPLTQVRNRRYFDEIFLDELRRASRSHQPLALLLVDIDHFKQVNDNFGHLMGDECLRLVARAIARVVNRETDLVARYGGEEFATLLPFTQASDAWKIAEHIRREVETICVIHQGKRIPLSVSIGVAGCIPTTISSPEDLIQCADEALYQAKHAGRNQSRLASA